MDKAILHKVGVVIVSYNASTAVRATLASLRQARNETLFEVLLVDNASKEFERESICRALERQAAEANLLWYYLQLKDNLGFAGGNNVGIKKFLEDESISHICLLNSDVIVSDFWLDRLIEKQCEIVSAVTNKADSEQCVPVDYDLDLTTCLDPVNESIYPHAFDTINTFSQDWHRAWRGNVVCADVTFFCVLLNKDLIQKVGLLDTNFFPGGYEDDDYCARIHAQGISIYLARDVFIHHWGSASFGQLQSEYFNENALRNKQYLENKHKFVWERRPQKPLVSYAQDILFALEGHGDRALQSHHHKLYINMLTRLISHYEQEFSNLKNLLFHRKREIPEDLEKKISVAVSCGSISHGWHSLVTEINYALRCPPCNPEITAGIMAKLASLTDAVYYIATLNLSIHEFLESVPNDQGIRQRATLKSKLHRYFTLLTNGFRIILRMRGIVFFGGYPYPEREKDGYFQRIRAIDSLFTDRWRIYVDHAPLPGREGWYDFPELNTLVLNVTGTKELQFAVKFIAILCALRCRVIYFHSVLRMEDSRFGNLLRLPGITKLIDIHGVVPEEFRYHNDFYSACLYEQHERLAVSKCHYVIVVSEAMRSYLQQKYREALRGEVITFPIFPHMDSIRADKSYLDGNPVVVYAGGLHKWQQVPKMIDAISKTEGTCQHRFYCPNPDEFLAMLPEMLRNNPHLIVESKSHEELLRIYPECHYGFILREDIIVNHAACPTKLVEYIAMGIVPIADCENIGDFKSMGMQYIGLKDFVSGRLPDEVTRNRMAAKNFAIYDTFQQLHRAGATILQHALAINTVTISQRFSGFIARQNRQNKVPSAYVAPSLPICDVLVQVDNFLAGGLENVVLDINEAMMKAGLRVGLLVLGEAGRAVERAKNMAMPVCVTHFDPQSYEELLRNVRPKVVITHYSIQGTAICSQLNIPLIQVIHNIYMWYSEEQVQQFSESAQHTAAFVAVSDFVKKYSVVRLGVPSEKCLVIPNGIDISRFRRLDFAEERNKLRAKHGLSDSDFIFLSVGSINHQKNHIGATKAFHAAFPDNTEVKLVILGTVYEEQLFSELQEYISQNRIENRVIYASESPDPHAYYSMADAFVHSAFFEGGPLVLLEALAANLPIVMTETGLAVHFKGREGIALVKPPLDILTYHGPICELRSTLEFEDVLATQMRKIYTERRSPNLQDTMLEMLDKRHSCMLYVKLLEQFIDTGQIPMDMPPTFCDSHSANHQ